MVLFFEGYILLVDFCHSLAYILQYVEQYMTFEQENFPSVSYAGRSGTDLQVDLMDLANYLGMWQILGSPISFLTTFIAPLALYLYKDQILAAAADILQD